MIEVIVEDQWGNRLGLCFTDEHKAQAFAKAMEAREGMSVETLPDPYLYEVDEAIVFADQWFSDQPRPEIRGIGFTDPTDTSTKWDGPTIEADL